LNSFHGGIGEEESRIEIREMIKKEEFTTKAQRAGSRRTQRRQKKIGKKKSQTG
jgi:hypothetical protein